MSELTQTIAQFERCGVLSCIDGRHQEPFAGAPGGDMGELVVLLSALEEELGRELWLSEVLTWLSAHTERFGPFYLHSDRGGIAEASKRAGVVWSERPTRHDQVALLDALSDAACHGCGHLAAMLADPDGYRVRRELVVTLIRGFFIARWGGDPQMTLSILEGPHRERAVVIYESTEVLSPETELSLHVSDQGEGPTFSLHAAAVDYMRRKKVGWVVERMSLDDATSSSLLATVNRLGAHQLDKTLAVVASGLPTHRVQHRWR